LPSCKEEVPVATYQGSIFDADNHFCEAHDAFARHVPKRMRSRRVASTAPRSASAAASRRTRPRASGSFREHVWIKPFWEDDIPEVVEQMGADRVILGSDWPHMEGLEHPRDILEEIDGVAPADREKLLCGNTKALNERRPA
jgi:hypothetical protein